MSQGNRGNASLNVNIKKLKEVELVHSIMDAELHFGILMDRNL